MFSEEANDNIRNFIHQNSKKILLITANPSSEIISALIQLLISAQLKFMHIDCNKTQNIQECISDSIANHSKVIIVDNISLDNPCLKYNFTDLDIKCIYICDHTLLHPTLDPSLYFSFLKGNRLQKPPLTWIKLPTKQQLAFASHPNEFQTIRKTPATKNKLQNHILSTKIMTDDSLMMQMFADRVLVSIECKKYLFSIIYASRHSEQFQIAAANAITALCLAKVSFAGLDLSYIRIPRSNLRFGVFHKTNFSYADLGFSKLHCACLNSATLDGCNMHGVDFDECPSIQWNPSGKFAFDPQKKRMITFTASAGVFDTANFKEQFKLTNQSILCVAFHPIIPVLIIGDNTGILSCWSTIDGKLIAERRIHTKLITTVAFSQQGNFFVWSSSIREHLIEIWEIERNKLYRMVMTGMPTPASLCFNQDKYLTVLFNGRLQEIDLTARTTNNLFYASLKPAITVFEFDQSGQLLAVCYSNDNCVYLYDKLTNTNLAVLRGHNSIIHSLAWSSCGKKIASSSEDTSVRVWDANTGVCEQVISGNRGLVKIEWGPNDRTIFTCGFHVFQQGIKIWNVSTSVTSFENAHYHAQAKCLAYSNCGKYIAAGSIDSYIRLLSVQTGKCIYTFSINNAHQLSQNKNIVCVCFHPKDQYIVGAADEQIFIWAFNSSSPQKELKNHNQLINDLSFSQDGKLLASASDDKTVTIWNMDTFTIHCILAGHQEAVHCVRFSPCGSYVASSGGSINLSQERGNDIHLWDINTKCIIKTFSGHRKPVWRVEFSPNQNVIASYSSDYSLRLWSLLNNQCIVILEKEISSINTPAIIVKDKQSTSTYRERSLVLAFSSDGKMLISGRSSCLQLRFTNNLNQVYKVDVGNMEFIALKFNNMQKNFTIATLDKQNWSILFWVTNWTSSSTLSPLLQWKTRPILDCRNCSISQVKELSVANHELLKEKAAKGQPITGSPVLSNNISNNTNEIPLTSEAQSQPSRLIEFINTKLNFFLNTRPDIIEHYFDEPRPIVIPVTKPSKK